MDEAIVLVVEEQMQNDQEKFQMAIQDFNTARQKAAIQEVLSRLAGKSNALLSYDEVAEKLRLRTRCEGGNKTIPLAAIVGSFCRTSDFTRTFLPLREDDRQRWAHVKTAFDSAGGRLPPIEVYKVGEVYFVVDGNHRVSIARQEGMAYIEAHVIEVQTRIPFRADMSPEEIDALIIASEEAEFLAETHLKELRPNVDLRVTACNQFEKLSEQIRVREYLLQQERQDKVSFEEAVLDWYDHTYIPLAEAIRDRDLLRWFPNHSVTDFYLWICKYHAELEEETGWTISPESVAAVLSAQENHEAENQLAATGSWRERRLVERYTDKLFNNILVPLNGDPASWQTVEQALVIARHEGARLNGLHVVGSPEERASHFALQVQEKFNDMCTQAGVKGALVIEDGDIVRKISERARLADLTVLKIVNPPIGGLASLKSPFRAVINAASGPIMGLRGEASHLDRALIAFDDSPRAREALFVGTYLAEQWKTALTVFTALEQGRILPAVQDYARRYLEFHELEADFILENGSAQTLGQTLRAGGYNLLLMGSYRCSVLREVFIGDTLDYVLREVPVPIFICR